MGILVTVTGRLTREPEQRQSQNGGSYALISVAGNEGYGEQQETYYFGASIYGKRAETVLQNYHKGDLVLLHGQYSEYQGNDGNTYKALRYATVEMLNHRNQPQQQQTSGWGQADTSWTTNNFNSVNGNQNGYSNNGLAASPSGSPQNSPQGNLGPQRGNYRNSTQNTTGDQPRGQNNENELINDVPF